jgi:hypothetical protein
MNKHPPIPPWEVFICGLPHSSCATYTKGVLKYFLFPSIEFCSFEKKTKFETFNGFTNNVINVEATKVPC